MSLYAIGQRVWCKSQQFVGTISEANYVRSAGGSRRAQYLVRPEGERHPIDYLTGSDDLRAADWCCDACGRWLPGRPHQTAPDGEYPNGLQFCFLCSAPQVLVKDLDMAEAYGYTFHP